MITRADKMGFIIIALLLIGAFIFWRTSDSFLKKPDVIKIKKEKENDNIKKEPEQNIGNAFSEISIDKKWDLPTGLKEISGIAYVRENYFACVQDEVGKIFIFNSTTGKVEKGISFSGRGDYEDISVAGNIAYVVRADGTIFEVDMNSAANSARVYRTSFTEKNNIEGLCFDDFNNRLLLTVKDEDPRSKGYKGIYAFDLEKKKLLKEPVFKIDLSDEIFDESEDKNKTIMPSALAIDPVSNDLYITDGPKARLLIVDRSGKIKKLYPLSDEFSQPDGITFSPTGEIFISNEGTKQPGNILKIQIAK